MYQLVGYVFLEDYDRFGHGEVTAILLNDGMFRWIIEEC